MTVCCPIVIPTSAAVVTTSLLHFNGTDGTSVASDEYGHAWSPQSGWVLDDAQEKFGVTSGLFNGGYLDGPGTSTFSFGTGDFTIDLWFYTTADATQQALVDFRTGDPQVQLLLYIGGSRKLHFYVNGSDRIVGGSNISTDQWLHAAVTRSSGTTRLFLQGFLDGSPYSDSNDYIIQSSRPRIGMQSEGTGPLVGWLDEVRMIKGTAAWTAGFTPPTSAYSPP